MFAEIFVLNFLRVSLADGRHVVGVNNAALHEVDCVIELKIAVVEIFPVQTEHVAHNVLGEDALIFEVVNRVKRFDVFVTFVALMFELEQDGNQSRMPIVGVDNVGPEVNRGQAIQNRAAEERVTLRIVVIAVETFAGEIFFVVHEIISHAVEIVFVDADVFGAPRNGDCPVENVFHAFAILLADFAELREDNANINALLLESFRE